MNHIASTRITTIFATSLIAAGITAGAWTLASPPAFHYVADYGASDTARIGMEHAQHEGVQHQHNGGHDHDSQ